MTFVRLTRIYSLMTRALTYLHAAAEALLEPAELAALPVLWGHLTAL